MPCKSTLNFKGDSDVSVSSSGHETEKLTVTLAAFEDGTNLSPLVHLSGMRLLPKDVQKNVPSGIVVYMCGTGRNHGLTKPA